ncbi:ABC transporter substrate-binding protein [Phytoactinopolyspora mesophila]|uniref:Extracellular solute-binding protein n=1 Tax=Phytoactinopolyspora mesophila TaxID=2650750 RepID=A0A7K3M155_9ACTN|nr:ABC transporter substrate-binding protein [Phytoactinopolyspora mesophila]NDL56168.1 extracellular solute-binding protein [Phytoactinopolyspora mesophila]
MSARTCADGTTRRRTSSVWPCAAALAASAALVVAACGNGDDAAAGGDTDEPVTLVFSSWFTDAELAVADELIAEFEDENPHITVDHQITPWADYATTLQTRVGGGQSPDVMFLSQLFYQGFADIGAIAPIDEPAQDDADFNIADFNEELLASGYYEDQLYWIPYGIDMQVLFYNTDKFDEAGLDYPDESWTWDDLRQAAAELTVEDNGRTSQYGLIAQNDFASGWNWIWQNGGQVLNAELTGGEMSSPATVEALSFFEEMITEDGSVPSPDVIEDLGYTQAFAGGNAAMGIYGAYFIPTLEADADFEWGTTVLPSGPANRNSFASGAGWTISTQTDHPDEAWALVSHMASEDGLRKFMELGSITPPRTSLYESPDFLEREAAHAFAEQAEHLTPLPISPQWNEYYDLITDQLEGVYRGDLTLEEATRTIDDGLASILGG